MRRPTHSLADGEGVDPDRAAGVAEVGLGAHRQQPAQDLVGGPLHRGHRGDAEPLVDLGAAGVVDPGHDAADAEGLAGHPGRDDVGVVAAGDRGEGVGAVDAGGLEDVAVEADAGDLGAAESRAEAAERVLVGVDHRHGVVAVLEVCAQRAADATASHDDDVHGGDATPRRRPAGRTVRAAARGDLALAVVGLSDFSKRLLLGRKLRSSQLGETLLPKRIAFPVFASDALSSVAYAPDEIFIMLALAGVSVYALSWQVALAVALVMLVVVASYRQNVHAYPSRAAATTRWPRSTSARTAGVTVACALLVDYVLTVAVSLSSAAPVRRLGLRLRSRPRGVLVALRHWWCFLDGAQPARGARVRHLVRAPRPTAS